MQIRTYLLFLFLFSFIWMSGQQPLSQIDKSTHLTMLKEGVLLVRLSDKNKKIAALKKEGLNTAASNVGLEQERQNEQVAKAFQTHFNYCTVHFIRPQETKSIIKDKSKKLKDVITGDVIDLSGVKDIYVTDYGFGHPAEGFERYNRKGFQILYLEEGKITDLGRDLFYAGVKQGIFTTDFDKSLQKTILKFNRRLESGSKYLN